MVKYLISAYEDCLATLSCEPLTNIRAEDNGTIADRLIEWLTSPIVLTPGLLLILMFFFFSD